MRDANSSTSLRWLARGLAVAIASGLVVPALGAVPGITGALNSTQPAFSLQAAPGFTTQPDGTNVYTWGYGCLGAPQGFAPATVGPTSCGAMQLPGPTLIVTQGDTVSVTLTNNLPAAAGSTSILFPGFDVTAAAASTQPASCTTNPPVRAGLLATEAAPGCAVTYTFTASKAGTHAYHSGTQGDLQVEMGLFGAIIVLPGLAGGVPPGYTTPSGHPATCRALGSARPTAGGGEADFRLAAAAYDHPSACYDREYLFQLSSMDLTIHQQAERQKDLACAQPSGCMVVSTEPYVPTYFMVNGRSFPDVVDPNYATAYPAQPYNGNPHLHPGELVLLRIIGTDRWQHTLHEHGNHVRLLARDGNMLLTATNKLAGPLLFTTTSTPGQALDGIYQWTSKGLNWDVFGHFQCLPGSPAGCTPATLSCTPDANGYNTTGAGVDPAAPNYYEWCADHEKALEKAPFGRVGSGGPVTLPDPTIVAMGPWYGGSPYLSGEATARAAGATPVPPSGTVANTDGSFAFMWHSHNEREITTNNAFPGGMMMMMLVDPWTTVINEAN